MKFTAIFLITFLFLANASLCQEISRHEADSMIIALNTSKPGVERIDLLLNLAQFHIFKRGENKIDLDSAAFLIDEAKKLNQQVNSTNAYGYLLLTESCLIKERGEKAAGPSFFRSVEGKKMMEKALSILQTGTNPYYLGRAYFELSWYYDYTDSLQLPKKIELVRQSVPAFKQARDFKSLGRSLEMLGDLYMELGEYDQSIQFLKESLAAYNAINYQKLQGFYVLLGYVHMKKRDYAPALFNLLKALKIAQAIKDSSMQLCQINNYLGQVYINIDRMDIAHKYLNEALEIARLNDDENALFWVAISLSSAYINLRQPDQSLRVLGYISQPYRLSENVAQKVALYTQYLRTNLALLQLHEAHRYCDTLLLLADNRTIEQARKVRIYMYTATYYFLSHQYAKARNYLSKSNAISTKMNYELGHIHNLELSYQLDSAEGNFRSAYHYLQLYKQKTDSVFSEKKARQFQVMNVEYEVEMKDDSIKSKNKDILLLTQKNNLQQENLKQASLIRNFTVAGIVLAFILIGLLYRQYRRKQKNNRVITQKNEQLQHLLSEKDWLIKEIHHRVKNNLQMVISLLNAQTEFLTHPSAIGAITESRERMQAIAIIHQKLYQVDNSAEVNMLSYINELVDNIKNSVDDSNRILFKVDVIDVKLDISQSVPLGLLLNEAITNALKHAYRKGEKGLIQISLKYFDIDKLQLKIADNGIGLPADVDIQQSNTLGMKLIRLFSEQLEGDLYFVNNNGLEIILNFKTADYRDATINRIIA